MQKYVLARNLGDDTTRKYALNLLPLDWEKEEVSIVSPEIAGDWYVQTAAESPLHTYLVELIWQFYGSTIREFDDKILEEILMGMLTTGTRAPTSRLSKKDFVDRLRKKMLKR